MIFDGFQFEIFSSRSNCETFCNMIVFNKPKSTQTEQTTACIRGKCLSKVLLLTSFNQNHFRHVLLHHLPQVQNVEATRRPDRGEAEEKRFGLNNNNGEVPLTPCSPPRIRGKSLLNSSRENLHDCLHLSIYPDIDQMICMMYRIKLIIVRVRCVQYTC